jgi:hypothetical protein
MTLVLASRLSSRLNRNQWHDIQSKLCPHRRLQDQKKDEKVTRCPDFLHIPLHALPSLNPDVLRLELPGLSVS